MRGQKLLRLGSAHTQKDALSVAGHHRVGGLWMWRNPHLGLPLFNKSATRCQRRDLIQLHGAILSGHGIYPTSSGIVSAVFGSIFTANECCPFGSNFGSYPRSGRTPVKRRMHEVHQVPLKQT